MFFEKYISLLSATLMMGFCASPWHASAAARPTTTALAITSAETAVETVTAGTVVTFTATVTAGGTAVTPGRVKFCDAAATYCTDIHVVGTAQLTSTGTATVRFQPGIGSHSYKAIFVGTTTNAASTSSDTALAVTGTFPTTTAIAASGTAGNYTLTATVTGYMDSLGAASPTGSVSFLDAADGYSRLGRAELGKSTGSTTLSFLTSQPLLTVNLCSYLSCFQSAAVGDFNGDGIADLVAADYFGTVTISLGKGDGTFTQTTNSLALKDYGANSVAVGDFNGDGKLDLAVAHGNPNYCTNPSCAPGQPPGYMTIFLGNGDGTFTQVMSLGLGSGAPYAGEAYSVAVGDLNGDGIPDLAVAYPCGGDPTCRSGGTISILLGNGDGTFAYAPNGTLSEVSIYPVAVIGDFNGDGVPDLAVLNQCGGDPTCQSGGTISLLLGNGDATFREATNSTVSVGFGPTQVVMGDFNGDGKLDLAVTNNCGTDVSCQSTGTVSILLSNGDGTFTQATDSPVVVGIYPSPVAVGDFNGDGIADLAVVNIYGSDLGGQSAGTVSILLGNGDGTFAAANSSVTVGNFPLAGDYPASIAVGDFNGDGISDFVAFNDQSTSPVVLSQLTQTASATVTAVSPVGSGTHNIYAGYDGDVGYSPSVSASTPLIAQQQASFTISGTTVTVAPGAISGNVSTITVTPAGGFTGQVALTAALTASPAGAQYPPTLSFGSTSPVTIAGANSGTATLTISTTPATRAALSHSQDRGVLWYMASGATLACLLLFGIPARRDSWLRMLSLLAILMAFVGGILACGGGGGGGGTSIPGTTAGSYTITVTGTSGKTTVTYPFAITVQ